MTPTSKLREILERMRKCCCSHVVYDDEYDAESIIRELLAWREIGSDALEFYGAENTWSPDNFLCGSEKMRSDLSETKWSRFTPGARAREALRKIEEAGKV